MILSIFKMIKYAHTKGLFTKLHTNATLLTKEKYVSLLAALIFLIHPVQTESVAWISGRADVLFLCFFLASLILYIKHNNIGRIYLYFGSLLCFSFAILSKEMAASLPFVLILYDLFYGKKEKIWLKALKYFGYFLIFQTSKDNPLEDYIDELKELYEDCENIDVIGLNCLKN